MVVDYLPPFRFPFINTSMWYYAKSKNKIGPISDAAMERLYLLGEIDGNTLVWRRKKWGPFSETNFYKRLTSAPDDEFKKNLAKKTGIFRTFLVSTAIYMMFCAYIMKNRLDQCVDISLGKLSQMDIKVSASEFNMTLVLSQIILLVLVIFLGKAMFNWIKFSTEFTLFSSRSYKMSPYFSAWAPFIPFFNLIYPCSWMVQTCSAILETIESEWSPWDIALVALWWFFTIFSFTLLAIDIFFLPSLFKTNIFNLVLYFGIYSYLVTAFACLVWVAMITRMYHLFMTTYKNFSSAEA